MTRKVVYKDLNSPGINSRAIFLSVAMLLHPRILALERSTSMSIRNEKYGFIYVWYDRKHKRFYIGSHWGAENDGYICSSRVMRRAYNRRREDFKRRVVKRVFTNRVDLLREEERWLKMIDPNKTFPKNTTTKSRFENVRYYNVYIGDQNQWWAKEESRMTVGQKISAAKKGKKTGPRPESVGKAISEAKKAKFAERGGISEQHLEALRLAAKNRNYNHTEEWKVENSRRLKEQWSDGTRKRAEPKSKMTKEEQALQTSERLKSRWQDPEWRAKQQQRLKDAARKRPPRSEESKLKARLAQLGKSKKRGKGAKLQTLNS